MLARTLPRTFVAAAAFAAFLGVASRSTVASAQPPDPELLRRLGHESAKPGPRMTYRLVEEQDELDGSGNVKGRKVITSHVETDEHGHKVHQEVERCIHDGKDETEQERASVKRIEENHKQDGDVEVSVEMPFSAQAQSNYVFDQVAVDPAHAERVKIAFTPKKADEHSVQGTAWIDTTTATVISTGVRFVKTPMFVDWAHFTVEWGPAPGGSQPSHVTYEGAGGFLFWRAHLRGEMKMSDYRAMP
jgi:hypothetical protein